MGVDYFQTGIDFAEYCINKYGNKPDFDILWNEFSQFGIFEKFTSEDSLSLNEKIQLMKGLGYGTGSVGILFSINVQIWACIMPLLKFGKQKEISVYIQKMQQGTCIGAHAISEPETGSDAFNLRTYYQEDEEGYHLTGTKCFVSNSPVADAFLVYAKKKNASGFQSISCFLVDKQTPGLNIGVSQEKMGMNGSPFGDVTLNNCIVPRCMLIGREGQGMNIFNYTMIHERPLLLAFQVGIMERQFNDCLKYVKSRRLKNQKLLQYESVSNRIADMKTRVYISNLILEDCAKDMEQNKMSLMLKTSIAKLSISEMLCSSCMDAASQLRDSIGSLFYSGTSDIQRNIISSLL